MNEIVFLSRLHPCVHWTSLDFSTKKVVLQKCINAQDSQYYSPLHLAVSEQKTSCVTLLLNKGARADLTDELGNTPLHLAIDIQCSMEIVSRLICCATIDVELCNNANLNVLHLAVQHGNLAIVKMLLEKFPTLLNKSNRDGYVALHLSARHNQMAVMERLVANGANLEARTKKAQTALLIAAAAGYVHIIDYLLMSGADKSAVDDHGNGAVHVALQNVR